jgi:hypothetical protein
VRFIPFLGKSVWGRGGSVTMEQPDVTIHHKTWDSRAGWFDFHCSTFNGPAGQSARRLSGHHPEGSDIPRAQTPSRRAQTSPWN